MRKAFTLIEVIVATSILSIVALGLLQVHSSNTKLIERMSEKYHLQEEFSLVLLNSNQGWHNSNKSLFDFVSQNIQINNDKLKTWMKNYKVNYTDKEFSKIELLSKDIEQFSSILDGVDIEKLPELKLVVNKISMSTSQGGGHGYTVRLE